MKKVIFILLSLVIIFYSGILYSQTFPLISNMKGKNVTSLDGQWKYIPDPMESGIKARFYLDKDFTDKTTCINYNFEDAETLIVPVDWNTQRPELLYYQKTIEMIERTLIFRVFDHGT